MWERIKSRFKRKPEATGVIVWYPPRLTVEQAKKIAEEIRRYMDDEADTLVIPADVLYRVD